MIDEAQVREMRHFRQASAGRLRSGAVIGLVLTGLVALLVFVTPGGLVDPRHPKPWLALVGLYSAWFPLVDDWLNVLRLDRRIAAAERDSA